MRIWGDGFSQRSGLSDGEHGRPRRRRGRQLGVLTRIAIGWLRDARPAGSDHGRGRAAEPLYVAGIPVDFILFALTLLGVALFHHHTLQVALTGLAAITLYKLGFTGFKYGDRPCRACRCTCSTSG